MHRRRLTPAQSALLLGRIYRLMATTPDWQRWYEIDLETLTVHIIPKPEWKVTP
jgi:hypothetical protein